MKRITSLAVLLLILASYAGAGTITRPIKACTGTSAFGSNCVLTAAELNADFDLFVNEFNGGIEDVNVDGNANIDPSKIGDYSATAAEHGTDSSPGVYGAETLPTTLEVELQQIRYKLAQACGTQGAIRRNAAGVQQVDWIELCSDGHNVAPNSSFFLDSDADTTPDGWSLVVNGTTLASNKNERDGPGKGLSIVGLAAADGAAFTFEMPRNDTRYLIVARVSMFAGTAEITTTGADAAGEWRDIAATDLPVAGASNVNYTAVVEADGANPTTDILVNFLCTGGACTILLADFGIYELTDVPRRDEGDVHFIQMDDDVTETWVAGAGFADIVGLSISARAPDDGYMIHVHADGYCHTDGAGNGSLTIDIEADGAAIDGVGILASNATTLTLPWSLDRWTTSVAKQTVVFTVSAAASTTNWTCLNTRLSTELVPAG
jgi:hypothetical protein